MILRLSELPATLKGPNDPSYKGQVPKRARFLAPDAAKSLMELLGRLANNLVLTDVFRSPEASLAARQVKRGVQRPGYSAHNYGLAVDLDIDPTLVALKIKYAELLEQMSLGGWFCHRRDGGSGMEAWHFNYGVQSHIFLADPQVPATWSKPIEAEITARYGKDFYDYDVLTMQTYLAKLRHYGGELDGRGGPLTREALKSFQRAWLLSDDGSPGPITKRTLALVAADRELVAL
jgi:hypothetical protein